MSAARRRYLAIREYDTVPILRDHRDPRRGVPARFVDAIERLQRDSRRRVLRIGRRHIQARQYVGTIGVPGFTLEVLPKVDIDDDRTRRRLLDMLAGAGMVPFRDAGISPQTACPSSLVEAFLRTYIERLQVEWRRGPIRDYLRRTRNRRYLKGKLDFPGHLRRNLLRHDRFHTHAEEFVPDVPLARVLRTALDICRERATTHRTRRAAMTLLGEFEDISPLIHTHDLDRIQTDRRTERFAELLTMAKLLLRSSHPDDTGPHGTFCLVFDMNQVFEKYVGRLLRHALAHDAETVSLQASGKSLLRQGTRRVFRLRPDIEIFRGKQTIALVDTKWKRLDPAKSQKGVSQPDAYQAYAYGKEYRTPTVVLLYPRTGDLGASVATYRHAPGDEASPRVEIATIDLRHNRATDLAQCRDLVDSLCLDASNYAGSQISPGRRA